MKQSPVRQQIQMSSQVLVLGMHRSGTSLLAELLALWGLDAGPADHLLQADRRNSRGYWESVPLIRFNDALLRAINRTWNVPPDDAEDAAIAGLLRQPHFASGAESLLREMAASGRTWFWKDPRLALLLPFWMPLLPHAAYIVCLRNPVSIAQSLLSRDRFPISASLLLWQLYMLKVLRHILRSRLPTLLVRFEDLIDNPVSSCERLSGFLEAQCADAPTEPPIAAMASAVDGALAHHCHAPALAAVAQATEEQRALWSHLLSRADGSVVETTPERFPIYAGHREYLEAVESLRRVGAVLQRYGGPLEP